MKIIIILAVKAIFLLSVDFQIAIHLVQSFGILYYCWHATPVQSSSCNPLTNHI